MLMSSTSKSSTSAETVQSPRRCTPVVCNQSAITASSSQGLTHDLPVRDPTSKQCLRLVVTRGQQLTECMSAVLCTKHFGYQQILQCKINCGGLAVQDCTSIRSRSSVDKVVGSSQGSGRTCGLGTCMLVVNCWDTIGRIVCVSFLRVKRCILAPPSSWHSLAALSRV